MIRYSMLSLALLGLACAPDQTPETEQLDPVATAILAADAPETLTYHPDLQVNLESMTRTPTGLFFQDVTAGTGDSIRTGERAVVQYRGWLPDGTLFDSSTEGAPFVFQVGRGDVIPGWEEGISGMRVGGVRKLVIPSHLGYGPEGVGPIPPNATLVFDVELVEIRP